jgi:hypothetical protein
MGIDFNARDESANPPISALGYASALPQAERAFSSWSIDSDKSCTLEYGIPHRNDRHL